MAGNNSLQMLRGTSSAIAASTATLLAGQPLYDMTNNLLYVGDGSTTQIKNKTSLYTERLVSKDNAGYAEISGTAFRVYNTNGTTSTQTLYLTSTNAQFRPRVHALNDILVGSSEPVGVHVTSTGIVQSIGSSPLNFVSRTNGVNIEAGSTNSPGSVSIAGVGSTGSISLTAGTTSTTSDAYKQTLDVTSTGIALQSTYTVGTANYGVSLNLSKQGLNVQHIQASQYKNTLSLVSGIVTINDALNVTNAVAVGPVMGSVQITKTGIQQNYSISTLNFTSGSGSINIKAGSADYMGAVSVTGVNTIGQSTVSVGGDCINLDISTMNYLHFGYNSLSLLTTSSGAQTPNNDIKINSTYISLGRAQGRGLSLFDTAAYFGPTYTITSTSDGSFTNITKIDSSGIKVVGSTSTYYNTVMTPNYIGVDLCGSPQSLKIYSTGIALSRSGGGSYLFPKSMFSYSTQNVLGLAPVYSTADAISASETIQYYYYIQGVSDSVQMKYFYRSEDNGIATGVASTFKCGTIIWAGKGGICGEGYIINPNSTSSNVYIKQSTIAATTGAAVTMATISMAANSVCKFFLYRPTPNYSSAFYVRFA